MIDIIFKFNNSYDDHKTEKKCLIHDENNYNICINNIKSYQIDFFYIFYFMWYYVEKNWIYYILNLKYRITHIAN